MMKTQIIPHPHHTISFSFQENEVEVFKHFSTKMYKHTEHSSGWSVNSNDRFSKILKYLEKFSCILTSTCIFKTCINSITRYYSSAVRKYKVFTLIFLKWFVYLKLHYFPEVMQDLTSFNRYQNC
jgi:hypothetical protein